MREVPRTELPALSDALALRGISLRKEMAADVPFLLRLYVSVRWPELEPTNWPDEMKQQFLGGQFQVQRSQYCSRYSDLDRWIVEHGTEPIGRLYLLHAQAEIRLVDVSLLPEWRNQGIGGALLEHVGRQAEAHAKSLQLHVEQHNPAIRLYRRLGFRVLDDTGLYWLMERLAAEQCGNSRREAPGGVIA